MWPVIVFFTMSLTNCLKCEWKISTEAESCPHCGLSDPVPPKCKICEGWIYEENKSCPTCGDPNPLEAKESSASTVKCRKCENIISPNAKDCPHCNCETPAPVECQACGGDVDYERSICLKCGHPLSCSGQSWQLVECRKCENKTSTEAECCPQCNCADPIIELLPFIQCRENGCGSIIHKEAEPCPYCGCPEPAPTNATTLKADDYAVATFLVKREDKEPERYKTNEVIDRIKLGQILPQQKMTIDGPDKYHSWHPAYYYSPFSEYEGFDPEKAAEKAEEKLSQQLLIALSPSFLLSLSSLVGLIMKKYFFQTEMVFLGYESVSPFALLGAVIYFWLTLCVYWRYNEARYLLIGCYLLSIGFWVVTLSDQLSDSGARVFLIISGLFVAITVVGLVRSGKILYQLGSADSVARRKKARELMLKGEVRARNS